MPLFVVEYLARPPRNPSGRAAPHGVREFSPARLDAVGETAGQLLAAAAVIGRSFPTWSAALRSGRGEDETVAGLEELTRRGLLVERDTGYAFWHDKLLAAAYERTSLARRRLLHRRVAEGWRRGGRPGAGARHLLAAGLKGEPADAFRASGDRPGPHASSEAIEAYRARSRWGTTEPSTLHEAIGDLHTLARRVPAATSAYEAAAALGGGTCETRSRAEARPGA